MAKSVAETLGTWQAFACALSLVVLWFLAGFHYGFDNQLYQLIINTGTTIITFLMVFLLQHTQNRDTIAIQLKLDELIRTSQASNRMMQIEDKSEDELRIIRDHQIVS